MMVKEDLIKLSEGGGIVKKTTFEKGLHFSVEIV